MQWSRLDNAAKIFPPTSTRRDDKVFRFACVLREPVDAGLLQRALDRTIEQFPFYRSVLKKGLFWYYFEESVRTPMVTPEGVPCAPLYSADRKDLLFRVCYYGSRISLEVYHALSDGTGALEFLRALVFYYLTERHQPEKDALPALDYDASREQKRDDSFSKYFEKPGKTREAKAPKAYRLRGERMPDYRIGIVEMEASVEALLKASHAMGATLTEFLCAVLVCSIHDTMSLRDEARPVVLTIPVNLRNYFPSVSARNFFSVINAGYCFRGKDGSLEAVAAAMKKNFQESLTEERLRTRMNRLSALEHNLAMKLVPLALKDPILRFSNWLAEGEITAAFSNIGKIAMPPELAPYIRSFSVFTSTNRLQACMCSFLDRATISFSSHFQNRDIQRAFVRRLTAMGVEVIVTAD